LLIDNINVWKIFLITDIQIFDNTEGGHTILELVWYVPTRKKKIEEKKETSKPTQPEFFFLTAISLVYTIIIITIICAGIVCVYIGTRVTWRKSGRTREGVVYNMRGKKTVFLTTEWHTSICVQTSVRRQRRQRRVYRKVLLSYVAVLSQRFLRSSNIYIHV